MELGTTNRGFVIIKFKDDHNNECSLQKSSNALEDCVWLGIDNPRLTVFEDDKMEKYITTKLPQNWTVDSRMHLTRDQVTKLLPLLKSFSETGELLIQINDNS